jgi:hypothetical protein
MQNDEAEPFKCQEGVIYKENGPHGPFGLDFSIWWSTRPIGLISFVSIFVVVQQDAFVD